MNRQRIHLVIIGIVLILIVASCTPASNTFPTGVYQTQNTYGSFIISFKSDGTYAMAVADLSGASITGTYTLNGNQISFINLSGESYCSSNKGTYTWTYDNKTQTLAFTGSNDNCNIRWSILVANPLIKKT